MAPNPSLGLRVAVTPGIPVASEKNVTMNNVLASFLFCRKSWLQKALGYNCSLCAIY